MNQDAIDAVIRGLEYLGLRANPACDDPRFEIDLLRDIYTDEYIVFSGDEVELGTQTRLKVVCGDLSYEVSGLSAQSPYLGRALKMWTARLEAPEYNPENAFALLNCGLLDLGWPSVFSEVDRRTLNVYRSSEGSEHLNFRLTDHLEIEIRMGPIWRTIHRELPQKEAR